MIRSLFFATLLAICTVALAADPIIATQVGMIMNRSTVGTDLSYSFPPNHPLRVWEAELIGASAVSATVVLYGDTVTCTSTSPIVATMNLTSAARETGFVSQAPWPTMCAGVAAISGVGASATLSVGQ
jgi:hypothetical protein